MNGKFVLPIFSTHVEMNRKKNSQGIYKQDFLYARGDEPFDEIMDYCEASIFSTHVEMNRSSISSLSGVLHFLYARGDEPKETKKVKVFLKFSLRTWR